MILLQTPSVLPTSSWEWFKALAPLLTGGVVGALITAYVTDRRNRIQPVGKRLTVATVDIPAIMPGYNSEITLSNSTNGSKYHFTGLSKLQLELTNSGNKDIDSFDVGINLPEEAKIIGVQHKTPDRYHTITQKPVIGIDEPANYADFILKPFNRKDSYLIILVVSYTGEELIKKVKLSKIQSVRFVDELVIDKIQLDIIRLFIEMPFPLGWTTSLLLPKPLRDTLRANSANSK